MKTSRANRTETAVVGGSRGLSKEIDMPPEIWEEIQRILKRGNTVELKKVGGQIVVVEIERKVKIKRTVTTG